MSRAATESPSCFQEYVISYPDERNGRRTEFRIEAEFAVAPSVEVVIRKGNGLITYSYQVHNGAEAKRPLREFALIAPVEDESIALKHPTWTVALAPVPQRPPGPVDGPRLSIRAGAGRIVSWNGVQARGIERGQKGDGFEINSRFLPGITTAFGSSAVGRKMPNGIPAEVRAQLEPVLEPGNNWRPLTTVGPKFNPDEGPATDPVWIASDYQLELERLRIQGEIGSPFIDEVMRLIEAVGAGGHRVPFRYRESPKTTLEAQIGEAAKIALSIE
jgi:hypothetical protein